MELAHLKCGWPRNYYFIIVYTARNCEQTRNHEFRAYLHVVYRAFLTIYS